MYKDPYWDNFPSVENIWHIGAFCFYVCLFICGLSSNLLVIVYYVKCEKLSKPYNFLLVNLMIADLVMILTNLPVAAINSLYGTWMFGQLGCNLYAFCGSLFGFVSIATMVLISVERCLVIKRPFKVLKSSKMTTIFWLLISWSYGFIWSISPFFGPKQYVVEGFLTSCTYDYISRDLFTRLILILMNIFGFFIPIIIMTISYAFILYSIKTHYDYIKIREFQDELFNQKLNDIEETSFLKDTKNFNVRKLNRTGQTSHRTTITRATTATCLHNETNIITQYPITTELLVDEHLSIPNPVLYPKTSQSIEKKRKKSFLASELKVTKNTILIIIVFCASWFPYALISIIAQFSENRENIVTPHTTYLPTLLAKASSTLNPIVYVFKNRNFKNKLRKFVLKRWNKKH